MKKLLAFIALLAATAAQPAFAAPPTGQWVDPFSGDFVLDFDTRTWDAVDTGCAIMEVVETAADRWTLQLDCGTADTTNKFDTLMIAEKTAEGLRVQIEGENDFTDLVQQGQLETTIAPPAASIFDGQATTWQGTEGAGFDDIYQWANTNSWECFQVGTGKTIPCLIVDAVARVYILRDSKPERVLFVGTGTPSGGNSPDYFTMIFSLDAKGHYQPETKVEGFLGLPYAVNFEEQALMLTTATLQGKDARCCPTGKTIWAVDYQTGESVYANGNRP